MLHPFNNFPESEVTVAPSPASSGTTLSIPDADASKFPTPSTDGDFPVIVFPATGQPTTANAEICTVTAKGGLSGGNREYTITRAQQGTSPRSIQVGDRVFLGLTKSFLESVVEALQIEGDITNPIQGVKNENDMASNSAVHATTQAAVKSYVDDSTPGDATTTSKGVVELATDTEAEAMSSDSVVLTPGSLFEAIKTGWLPVSQTLTYKDADEVYFSGDVTSTYQVGDKLKVTQPTDGVKYFKVLAVGAYDSGNDRTPVEVTGGVDFDLDNESFTSPFYSRRENPLGWESDNFASICVYSKDSSQSVSNNTDTKIQYDTLREDNLGEYDISNHRFVAKQAGTYSVTGSVIFTSNAGGCTLIGRVNGIGVAQLRSIVQINDSFRNHRITGVVKLQKGDYVEIFVRQTSGGSRNIHADSTSVIAVAKVG